MNRKAGQLRILHVTGLLNRGGAEVMITDLMRSLQGRAHFDFLVNYEKRKGISKGTSILL